MPRDIIESDSDPRPDLARPTLAGLEWVLRHREAWPADHDWFFGTVLKKSRKGTACGTVGCALGIAKLMWPGWRLWIGLWAAAPWYDDVFFRANARDKITPEIVAGRIRDVLAKRPIRFIKERIM